MDNSIIRKVFILCFLVLISFADAAIWENIPAFPQAVKIKQEETLINNNTVQITVYSTTEPIEKAVEFYKSRLTNFGWTLTSQTNQQGINLAVFSKGDGLINILLQNMLGKNFITITQSMVCSECEGKREEKAEGVPTSDTPGRDLQFVPRYPKAIRVSETERENGKKVAINYYTKDSVERALDFYRKNMGNYYWKLENEIDFQNLPEKLSEQLNPNIKGKSLVFKNSSSSCIISIIEEPQYKGTIIGVNYNEK